MADIFCPLYIIMTPNTIVPSISTYLKDNLKANALVGIDPTVHPAKFVQSLAKTLSAKQIKVHPLGKSAAAGLVHSLTYDPMC